MVLKTRVSHPKFFLMKKKGKCLRKNLLIGKEIPQVVTLLEKVVKQNSSIAHLKKLWRKQQRVEFIKWHANTGIF